MHYHSTPAWELKVNGTYRKEVHFCLFLTIKSLFNHASENDTCFMTLPCPSILSCLVYTFSKGSGRLSYNYNFYMD